MKVYNAKNSAETQYGQIPQYYVNFYIKDKNLKGDREIYVNTKLYDLKCDQTLLFMKKST